MAVVYAIKNGNWSDGSTWNTGSVPTAADDVYLNGYTIDLTTIENSIAQFDFKSLSNLENDLIVKGGYCKITTSRYGTTTTLILNGSINAIDNIVRGACKFIINGDINAEFTAQGTGINIGTIYCQIGSSENKYLHHTVNGNITTTGNNDGYVLDHSVQYQMIKVVGNVTLNRGFVCRQIQYDDRGGEVCGIFGTLTTYKYIAGSVHNIGSLTTISNANILGGDVNLAYCNIYNLIVGENARVNISYSTITNVVLNTLSSSIYNCPISAVNGLTVTNFYNNSNTQFLFYSDVSGSEITIKGEFHLDGNNANFGNSSVSNFFKRITAKENSKFYYSIQRGSSFAKEWIIESPETFEIIYEGQGIPPIQFIPYGNNAFKYPQESDVKNNVEYGMQNEYRGRYTPTILTEEQLQRIANCATMQEVAELSVAIANKDNE